MAQRDCMNCKNCVLRPMAYHNGVTNTCKFEDRISKLSMKELHHRITTNECEWFEKGKPKKSSKVCYDD